MSTSPDTQLYTAAAAADQLHVSPDTLRRWTKEFAAQLSATAVGAGYYRYSGADIKRLQTIRDLLSEGKTANEIARQLSPHEPEPAPPADDHHEAVIRWRLRTTTAARNRYLNLPGRGEARALWCFRERTLPHASPPWWCCAKS